MKPILRCMRVVAVALALAPCARAGATPEDLFKDKGLTKVGLVLVTAQEAEIHSAANSVRGLKARVTSETLARSNMARAVQTATDIALGLESQLANLDAQMRALKKNPGEFNLLVEPYNDTLRQYKVRKANLDELRKKQGQIEDSQVPFSEAAIAGVKKADAAAAVYAALAQDAGLKAAIDSCNKGSPQPLKLGPSANFLSDSAFLRKCVGDMAAQGVPARMEGGVPVVEVVINGLKHDMVWDSGASAVCISDDTAAELGLRVTSHDRLVEATLADGRKVKSRLIVIPLIRVGVFTAENVECLVDPPGPVRGPDLLGGTFQRHFLCRMDQTAGVLHLTPIDTQASEAPVAFAAPPAPVATATPAATPPAPVATDKRLVQYLSELTEIKAERIVRDGLWDVSKDVMTKSGRPLSVNGVKYHHGIGYNPDLAGGTSRITFALGGKYRRFTGLVGINDTSGDFAAVLTFKIVGNGREMWKSQPYKETKKTQPFDVDLTGVDTLQLVVDCDGRAQGAHVVWLDPRLEANGP